MHYGRSRRVLNLKCSKPFAWDTNFLGFWWKKPVSRSDIDLIRKLWLVLDVFLASCKWCKIHVHRVGSYAFPYDSDTYCWKGGNHPCRVATPIRESTYICLLMFLFSLSSYIGSHMYLVWCTCRWDKNLWYVTFYKFCELTYYDTFEVVCIKWMVI